MIMTIFHLAFFMLHLSLIALGGDVAINSCFMVMNIGFAMLHFSFCQRRN